MRYAIEYTIEGTVLEGELTRRQYAVAAAQIVMEIDTDLPLHLALHPDIAQYSFDDESIDLVIPMLSAEWIETPIRLGENPRLKSACVAGEISLRLVTPTEERVLHATHAGASRWLSGDPGRWSPPTTRDRLLIQVGLDGMLNSHPNASKVRVVEESTEGDHLTLLRDLVLPERSACIFCDMPQPETREHVLPAWATPEGETGITVACCYRCNNHLSGLEMEVSEISRRGTADLTEGERLLVAQWALKTIWALGKALGTDPLRGSGDEFISRLMELGSGTTPGEPQYMITDIYTSVEASEPWSALHYCDSGDESAWAMLRVVNLVTSVWLKSTTMQI